MKSTTPRTDAQPGPIVENYGKMVPAYFARELEEELARVTAERDCVSKMCEAAILKTDALRARAGRAAGHSR